MKQLAFKKSPPGGGIEHVNAPSLDRQQRNVWTIRTDLVAAALFKRGIQNFHPIYDARSRLPRVIQPVTKDHNRKVQCSLTKIRHLILNKLIMFTHNSFLSVQF